MALYTARNLRDADLRDAPFHVDGTRTRTVIFDAGYPDMARRALATYLWRHGGLAASRRVSHWTITPADRVVCPEGPPKRPDSLSYQTTHLSEKARSAADIVVYYLRGTLGRSALHSDSVRVFWDVEAWNEHVGEGENALHDPEAILVIVHPDMSQGYARFEGDLAFLRDPFARRNENGLSLQGLNRLLGKEGFWAEPGPEQTAVYARFRTS